MLGGLLMWNLLSVFMASSEVQADGCVKHVICLTAVRDTRILFANNVPPKQNTALVTLLRAQGTRTQCYIESRTNVFVILFNRSMRSDSRASISSIPGLLTANWIVLHRSGGLKCLLYK